SAPPDALFPRTALSRLIQHCEPSLACRWLLPLTVELEPPRVPVCTTGPWGQASRDGLNPSSAYVSKFLFSEPASKRQEARRFRAMFRAVIEESNPNIEL
ncbi:hypothetical protein INR49_023668, partial [Caranx melampygus]